MSSQLPESARRVQAALDRSGLTFRVVQMAAGTRTAKEAAAAIGCTVAQIAKSILFRGAVSGNPILVVASGVNRVNEQAVAALAGEPLEKASPDFVREATGYAIGRRSPGRLPFPDRHVDRPGPAPVRRGLGRGRDGVHGVQP